MPEWNHKAEEWVLVIRGSLLVRMSNEQAHRQAEEVLEAIQAAALADEAKVTIDVVRQPGEELRLALGHPERLGS